MEWLLDHIETLLPIAVVLIVALQGILKKGEPPPDEQTPEVREAELEARRIQEEIRRKILARQQGRRPEAEIPVSEERPVFDEPPPFRERRVMFPGRPEPTVFVPEPGPVMKEPVRASAEPDLFERLRQEQERLRKAREAREKAVEGAANKTPRRIAVQRSGGGGRSLRRQLLSDLSTPGNLRRAIVLKEVIDRKF